MTTPCIHASPLPGETDRFVCKVAHAQNPTGRFCRDLCPVRVSAGEHHVALTHEAYARTYQGGYAKPSGIGLGDIVEKAISIATFGQGKRIANKLAGPKGCGCNRRKNKLNRIRFGGQK